MKPITLHPLSVLAGIALAGLAVVLTGAAQTPTLTHHPRTEVLGQIPAEWWVYVELTTVDVNGTITQQDTYHVPTDRRLVVTSSERSGTGAPLVNGTSIGYDALTLGGQDTSTRYVFQPGATLAMGISGSSGANTSWVHLWGYLEPVR